MLSHVGQGSRAEDTACAYLQQQGLRLVARNYRAPCGELDLIMQDGDFLVFVEVRYRAGDDYGHPLETVTRRKQQRICATAAHYLQSIGQLYDIYCRFDVVAVSPRQPLEFDWIKDAFHAAG